MLPEEVLTALADELDRAHRSRTTMPRITARYPEATIEDAYAIQRRWLRRNRAAGRRPVGHKIGLTSRAMRAATGITEPDYGVVLDGTVWENGSVIPYDAFSGVRVEVELAFRTEAPLTGPDCTFLDVLAATRFVVPALEILDSRVDLVGRTIVDTIADNAAYGGTVLGGNPVRPGDTDLRWVSALLCRNETIEESGVAAAVLNHPAAGVAWLANRLHRHGDRIEAGELVLSGSFTRPVPVRRGDTLLGDYGPMGTIACRFD